MKWNTRTASVYLALFAAILASTSTTACRTSGPVTFIRLFRVPSGGQALPPPGTWAEGAPTAPHPTHTQGIFAPGDSIFVGLKMSKHLGANTTFSICTFLNKATGYEMEIEPTRRLGPFEPGQVLLAGVPNPWPVPGEPGTYEFRIYVGDKMVASAVFEVRQQPNTPSSTTPP